jgi:hypothetical protein
VQGLERLQDELASRGRSWKTIRDYRNALVDLQAQGKQRGWWSKVKTVP